MVKTGWTPAFGAPLPVYLGSDALDDRAIESTGRCSLQAEQHRQTPISYHAASPAVLHSLAASISFCSCEAGLQG